MTPVKILILTAITVAFLMTANQAECAFEIFSHNSLDYLAEGSRNKYFNSRGWAFLQRTDKYSLPELAINSLEAGLEYHGMTVTTGWASSGDDKYLENMFSAGLGVRTGCVRWIPKLIIYNVVIKNCGSSTTPGIDLYVISKPSSNFTLEAGIDGMLSGKIRQDSNDIQRSGWSRLHVDISDRISLTGVVDIYPGGQSGQSLGGEFIISNQLGCRVLLADIPARYGAGVFFTLGSVELTFATSYDPPLGWTNGVAVGILW